MQYLLNSFEPIFSSEQDCGGNLYAGHGVTVQAYHLKKLTSLMERYEEPYLVPKHMIVYLIIRGSVEFTLDDEKVTVAAGQSITIHMNRNFSAWAVEDCDIISIHNCVEPDVDDTPKGLVTAVKTVELMDTYLCGHNYRVGKYATMIMQIIAPERSTPIFHLVAAFHDVGKDIIPPSILNKPGKLTKEEFDEIKKHPARSQEMLKKHVGARAAAFARWHHEKLDGSGYPDALKGDQIPLESQVMAVADIFDALTTARCYRSDFTFARAISILAEEVNAGKLNRDAFEALKRLVESGRIVEGVDNVLVPERPWSDPDHPGSGAPVKSDPLK